MRIIEAESAEEYLRERGFLEQHERIQATNLAGGVSNVVIGCESNLRPPFVLKQSRPQLRTKEPWFCSPERIWREVVTLRVCERVLNARTGSTRGITCPRVLFEDPTNYAFVMTAAAVGSRTWKSELLDGHYDVRIAHECAVLLATLHAETWHDPGVAVELEERCYFDALRVDPYYRFTSTRLPEFQVVLQDLERSVWNERHCLVHGDFSPKNLLARGSNLMLIDFEVGHYGDPAFDLGFFGAHLILKTIHRWPDRAAIMKLSDDFWTTYGSLMETQCGTADAESLLARAMQNLGGCLLARIAGKSLIDYPVDQTFVFEIVRYLLFERPTNWPAVKQFLLDGEKERSE